MQTSFNLDLVKRVHFCFFGKLRRLFFLLFVFLFASCQKDAERDHHPGKCDEFKKGKSEKQGKKGEPTVSVFATGFNNPRGLKFGPDCHLYVAEGGIGGTRSTINLCPEIQVGPDGGGPFLGSATGGRISRVSAQGIRTTVTENLPTVSSAFGDVGGVADL